MLPTREEEAMRPNYQEFNARRYLEGMRGYLAIAEHRGDTKKAANLRARIDEAQREYDAKFPNPVLPPDHDDIALAAAFHAHAAGQTKFTRRMAIAIADMFGETPRQIVLRLERLRLLKAGSWDWFAANGGITKENIAEARAELAAARGVEAED